MALLDPLEIKAALAEMPTGKVPGMDGLTVAFYKAFQGILISHLVTLYEEMAEAGIMPPSMHEH